MKSPAKKGKVIVVVLARIAKEIKPKDSEIRDKEIKDKEINPTRDKERIYKEIRDGEMKERGEIDVMV